MKDLNLRSLREDEHKRFFDFAGSLPENDFWGKKGRYLRGDYGKFKEFLDYIESFDPKCFLVAKEDDRLVGFVVAVYNPEWVRELSERYGYKVRKRAHVLGIAVAKGRQDVLAALTRKMMDWLHQKGILDAEYPTFGNVCLTTGTDILTPENLEALTMFREAGFKISDCYYSMKLDLTHRQRNEPSIKELAFHQRETSIEIPEGNEILGTIKWDPIENERTSIDVYIAPAHKGKGLGTALLEKALQRLTKEHAKEIELGVDGNNLPAIKLYRKFGFKVTKTHLYLIASAQSQPT
jgi:ribosomal protein S18 acetylase RimI-like enzyme